MLKQKEAVVNEVLTHVPGFQKNVDNAILKLSSVQLEAIKVSITNAIVAGTVEYSKDRTNFAEVRTYARSMVMNHLKKARELNGGHAYTSVTDGDKPKTVRIKEKIAPKGVNLDILPDDLKDFAKKLV